MDKLYIFSSRDQRSFQTLISSHIRMIKTLPPYTNEINLMAQLFTHSTFPVRLHDIQAWFAQLQGVNMDTLQLSRELRNKGNAAFNGTKRDVMAASRYYTMAIFNAPPTGTDLAMAHANRAIALQTAGYYQAAYDDGVCARAAGYPADNVGKVILRQAYCAARMGRLADLQKHMAEIPDAERQGKYKKDFEHLEKHLKQLKAKIRAGAASGAASGGGGGGGGGDGDNGGIGGPIVAPVEPKTIVVNPVNSTKRYLATKVDVKKHDLLFMDRAVAIVPFGKMAMCHNCGLVEHIPFPCNYCGGEVQYCSLKCRVEHQQLHQYECNGCQLGLFNALGAQFHLAMRIFIAELPQLVALLQDVGSENELWAEVCGRGHIISVSSPLGRSLLSTTHFQEMSPPTTLSYAILAQVMMYYVQLQINVHNLFTRHNLLLRDWELVLVSLCMRRLYQSMHHAQSIETLHCGVPNAQNGVHNLMVPNLWASPKRLAQGNCHMMASCSFKALAFFPYINHCRRTCNPDVVHHKYKGHQSWTYAMRDYKCGEPVQRHHHFAPCSTFKCPGKDPVAIFQRIKATRHQRCEFSVCGQEFISMPWAVPLLSYEKESIKCPKCGKKQPKMLLEMLMANMGVHRASRDLSPLFEFFNDLGNIYLGMHCVKAIFAQRIVHYCLEVQRCFHNLSDQILQKVAELALYNMAWQEKFEPEGSSMYTTSLMPLFDLIALGHYKPSPSEMNKMLQLGLFTVSDEFKEIIMNYYDDHVKPMIEQPQNA